MVQRGWKPTGWLGIVLAGAIWSSLEEGQLGESVDALAAQIAAAVGEQMRDEALGASADDARAPPRGRIAPCGNPDDAGPQGRAQGASVCGRRRTRAAPATRGRSSVPRRRACSTSRPSSGWLSGTGLVRV